MKSLHSKSIDGWEKGKLSSFVAEFIVPQRDKPRIFNGTIPWCRIEDFNGVYLLESKSKLCVSKETVEKMGLKIYPINTVIVSCSADLGRAAIISRPLVTNQTFIGLVPSNRIDPLFLYYYMTSISKKLNDMASGATIKYLSKKKFQELDVYFPPLLEQQKIAQTLDNAFKSIAVANLNTKNKLVALDALKKSLLNVAFSGKL